MLAFDILHSMETNIDIGQKAELNLKGLVKTLYKLLTIENKHYDLIIAPGTTGAFVCKLTEIIYHKLNVQFPPKLLLPIVRYKSANESPENLFDNSALLQDVIEQLKEKKIGNLKEILFVDDEIYGGNALRECLKLILKFKEGQQITSETICTVVAEDQGMSPDYSVPGVEINFNFYEKSINEYNNAITYFLPANYEDILNALGNNIGTHTVVNILFDLPIKPKGNNLYDPKFTYEFSKLSQEKIPNFKSLQKEAKAYTNKLIDQALEEIKNSVKKTL